MDFLPSQTMDLVYGIDALNPSVVRGACLHALYATGLCVYHQAQVGLELSGEVAED